MSQALEKNAITWRREIERYIFPQVHRVHPEGALKPNYMDI